MSNTPHRPSNQQPFQISLVVTFATTIAILLSIGLPSHRAEARSPGLALFSGFVIPDSRTSSNDDEGSHNFGFFVDLPLVSTFYISPGAELYKVGRSNYTDLVISFKFMVPLRGIKLFGALVPGITNAGSDRYGHLGLAAGIEVKIVSNIAFFGQFKYKETLSSGNGLRAFHFNGGLIFHF